jgi:hypothetical protein
MRSTQAIALFEYFVLISLIIYQRESGQGGLRKLS